MFTYKWNLKDLENVPKNGFTVFSCFAGGGWDYDIEYCSNRECDYEIVYDTSTDIDEDDPNAKKEKM